VAVALAAPAAALAQQPALSFADLGASVKVGSTVFVTDAAGVEREGKLVGLSGSSLALMAGGQTLELPAENVLSLAQRKPDSLKNGALIGFAVGAGLAVAVGVAAYVTDPGEGSGGAGVVIALVGGAAGAAIGAVVDASIPGKKIVVFQRGARARGSTIALAPVLTSVRQGVALAVSF
jgi:hypothetical protein